MDKITQAYNIRVHPLHFKTTFFAPQIMRIIYKSRKPSEQVKIENNPRKGQAEVTI